MKREAQEKFSILQDLIRQKEEIEAQIEKLLSPDPVIAAPANFDIYNEITGVFATNPEGMASGQVYEALVTKWGNFIERKKFNAALIYLANRRGTIEKVNGIRGQYRIKAQT